MKAAIARLFLRANGWEFEGNVPSEPRYVMIAAPHTSNWDLPYLLAFAWSTGVHVSWMGKHSLFHGPMGTVMRWLGGIPVHRSRRNSLVSELAREFAAAESLVLAVPAEGTRRETEYWKSGFYRIALAADVPIVPSFLDYARRRGGFGPPLRPTGDVSKDMEVLRHFYADKVGKYPQRFGPVRLREELDEEPLAP